MARLIANSLSRSLGTQFVVESRQPNVAAAAFVAKSTAEAGLPDLLANIWYGMLAPSGTPQMIIERLNNEVVSALRNPQIAARLIAAGVEPVGNSPQQFAAFAAAEFSKWRRVIDAAHIDVQY